MSKKVFWQHPSKKAGFGLSYGTYSHPLEGQKFFVLIAVRSGKPKVYASMKAAKAAGWSTVKT